MESYKDVVVSQPPQSVQTVNKVSLENYKGILLCDRPAETTSIGGGGGDDRRAFVPSGRTGNPLGAGPSNERRELQKEHTSLTNTNVQTKKSQSQAITRHKNWLRSFAKQVHAMKQSEVEQQVEAARRAERLRQETALRREREAFVQQEPYNMQESLDPFKNKTNNNNTASKKTKKGKAKPQWAMTENEALDMELEANNDLLDFAKSLDYDKFINDYEVTEALTVMRDRVLELAKANDWSEEDIRRAGQEEQFIVYEDEEEASRRASQVPEGTVPVVKPAVKPNAAAPGSVAQHDKGWDSSVGRTVALNQSIRKDAIVLAERLLAATPSMQKVHTKYTLARVLQQCALTGDVNVNTTSLQGLPPGVTAAAPASHYNPASSSATDYGMGTALAEPRVVQVDAGVEGRPDQQGRVLRDMQTSKERTQGLPYMYRCPAI
ncbi:hypothetical protein AGDE_11114 [Angomonas deanei]|nr:hypothetical protein AGDE_11114 [Angomonas deanei]|eukprot:EPY26743.1 hypothetical protein AGDE_11114 [Angomonas deanei]